MLRVPVEETQVSWLWQQQFLLLKYLCEVFSLKPVGQIDVSRDLVLSLPLVSDEDNGRHSTASHIILSVSQGLQKVGVVDFAAGVGQRLGLFGVLVLPQHDDLILLLLELLTSQDLTLAVVANLDELTG